MPTTKPTLASASRRKVISDVGSLEMMMEKRFQVLKAEHDGRSFRIEEDKAEIGWYLYVSQGGRCTHDHLQDTLARAKAQARTQYGVPENAWIEEEN